MRDCSKSRACWRSFLGSDGRAPHPQARPVPCGSRAPGSRLRVPLDGRDRHGDRVAAPRSAPRPSATSAHYRAGTEQHQHGVHPRVLWAVPDARRAEQIKGVLASPPHLQPTRLFAICLLDRRRRFPGFRGALVKIPAKLALYEDDTQSWGLIQADALMLLANLPDNQHRRCRHRSALRHRYRWCLPGMGARHPSRGGKRWAEGAQRRRSLPALERDSGRGSAHTGTQTRRNICSPSVLPAPFTGWWRESRTPGLEVRDQLLWLHAQGLPKSRRLPGGLGTCPQTGL